MKSLLVCLVIGIALFTTGGALAATSGEAHGPNWGLLGLQVDQSRECLHHAVIDPALCVGTRLAEAADREVDEPRIHRSFPAGLEELDGFPGH